MSKSIKATGSPSRKTTLGDEYVVTSRLRRPRVTRHITRYVRQHLASLLVYAERMRRW